MSGEVFIVGVGMTQFGRWPDQPLKSLVAEAVRAALKDAGTDAGTDAGAAYFANSTQGHLDGQHMIRGQIALRPLGIEGILSSMSRTPVRGEARHSRLR